MEVLLIKLFRIAEKKTNENKKNPLIRKDNPSKQLLLWLDYM